LWGQKGQPTEKFGRQNKIKHEQAQKMAYKTVAEFPEYF
jgi:hypothetical protein